MKSVILAAAAALSLALSIGPAMAQTSEPKPIPPVPMPQPLLIVEAPSDVMSQNRTVVVNGQAFTLTSHQHQKMIATYLTTSQLQRLQIAAENSSCRIKWVGAPIDKKFKGYVVEKIEIKLDKNKSGHVVCKEAKVTVAKAAKAAKTS